MACSNPPVQEMSDARQAIQSAEKVGAELYTPSQLYGARILMEKAQSKLELGAYDDARRYALDARDEAIRAREITRAELVQ